ncbi:MAG: hypothetical protein AB8B97_05590 [Granulosicoccus sp.]
MHSQSVGYLLCLLVLTACGGGGSGSNSLPVTSPLGAPSVSDSPVTSGPFSGNREAPEPLDVDVLKIAALTSENIQPYLAGIIELLQFDNMSLIIDEIRAVERAMFDLTDGFSSTSPISSAYNAAWICPGGGRVDTQFFIESDPEAAPSHRFEDCVVGENTYNSSYSHLVADPDGYPEQTVGFGLMIDRGNGLRENASIRADRIRVASSTGLIDVAIEVTSSSYGRFVGFPVVTSRFEYDIFGRTGLQFSRTVRANRQLNFQPVPSGQRVALDGGLNLSFGFDVAPIMVQMPIPFTSDSVEGDFVSGQIDITATGTFSDVYRLTMSADSGDESTFIVTYDNGDDSPVVSIVLPWSDAFRFKEPQVVFDTP